MFDQKLKTGSCHMSGSSTDNNDTQQVRRKAVVIIMEDLHIKNKIRVFSSGARQLDLELLTNHSSATAMLFFFFIGSRNLPGDTQLMLYTSYTILQNEMQ